MNNFGLTFTNLMPLHQKEALNSYLIQDREHNEVIEQAVFDYYMQPQKESGRPEQQDLLF